MIEPQDFLNHIEEQLEVLPSSLKMNTSFAELKDWNSLTGLAVLAIIRDEYNVRITLRDLDSISTINDLYKIAISKQQKNAIK